LWPIGIRRESIGLEEFMAHFPLLKMSLRGGLYLSAVVALILHSSPGLALSPDERKAENECLDAVDDARSSCSSAGSMAGMSAAQQQQSQQMQQQAQQNGQQTQQLGQAQAAQCQNSMDMSKLLSGLSALQGGACLFNVQKCREACGASTHEQTASEVQQINSDMNSANATDTQLEPFKTPQAATSNQVQPTDYMRRMAKRCEAYSPGGMAAFAQAAAAIAGMFMNKQCGQQAATLAGTPAPGMNCQDPNWASTPQCMCGPSGTNPKSSICVGQPSLTGGVSTTSDPMGPAGPSIGDNPNLTDGARITDAGGQAKPSSGSQTMDGGGGGGGLSGGRGAQLNDTGGGGDPRSNVPTGVITGQGSGSGGGGGGGVAGGGGGGPGGRGGGGAGRKGFNINDYLPKSGSRNIAGMSIVAKDGITAALGPSLFEKVSKQYQQQRSNMIQDK
jgi:hypothetical protein